MQEDFERTLSYLEVLSTEQGNWRITGWVNKMKKKYNLKTNV